MYLLRTLTKIIGSSLLSSSVLYSAALPEVIDFNNFQTSIHNYTYDYDAWRLGYAAFNYAPELTPVFAALKRDYTIDIAIETGTSTGSTTAVFAALFDEVHTIEIVDNTYKVSSARLKKFPNVSCHLGSSEKVLRSLLPTMKKKRILFYLDAHWEAYWPLLDELDAISKTHSNNCIIVIDDFKVPGRDDLPFDQYGTNECSYEYIAGTLNKVFSGYDISYLIPKSSLSRAKFIAIPKKWKHAQKKTAPQKIVILPYK